VPAAAVFNAAGENWTLSFFEAVNFGAFVGDPTRTKLILQRIINEAKRLKVKEVCICECGTAFRVMKPTGGNNAVSVKEVEAQVRQTLLSRYQAYHTKGFSGITPYQRGGGRQVLASDELSLSVKQMRLLAKYVLSVYDVLLNYPAGKTKDDDPKLLEEQFYWLI
jgi:hypothetical protein